MDYFAGLDISMDETHVCVLDREGMVVRESKAESTAQAVANELAKAPSCRRIVFETGSWRINRKRSQIDKHAAHGAIGAGCVLYVQRVRGSGPTGRSNRAAVTG